MVRALSERQVFEPELICTACGAAMPDEDGLRECVANHNAEWRGRDYREFLPGAGSVRDIHCVRDGTNAHVNIEHRFVVRSPTGFEWGYGGSGPADLALNILALFVPPPEAWRLHQQFKFDVIAGIPESGSTVRAPTSWTGSAATGRRTPLPRPDPRQPSVVARGHCPPTGDGSPGPPASARRDFEGAAGSASVPLYPGLHSELIEVGFPVVASLDQGTVCGPVVGRTPLVSRTAVGMSHDSIILPPTSAQAVLDRVWAENQSVPRAVAVLLYFFDVEEVVTELVSSGELELAAQVLAAVRQVRAGFEAFYGVRAQPAVDVFLAALMSFAQRVDPVPGEQVDLIVPVRLLSRLGYHDGLCGGDPVDNAARGANEPGGHASDAGMNRGVSEILGPAYDQGFEYGKAERRLVGEAPSLCDEIDAAIDSARRAGDLTSLGRADGGLLGWQERSGGIDADVMAAYIDGRVGEVCSEIAHAAVMRDLRGHGKMRPLAIGTTLRKLADELRQEGAEYREDEIADQLEEAFVLAAATGFSAGTIAALTEEEPRAPVIDIVSSAARQYDVARINRAVLRDLATMPAGCRARGMAATELVDGERFAEHGDPSEIFRDPESIRAWVSRLSTTDIAGDGSLLELARELVALDPTGQAAAAIVARSARFGLSPVRTADDLRTGFLRLEAELASSAETAGIEQRIEQRLIHEFADHLADAIVATEDPAAYDRTRAEVEIVERGQAAEAEYAEKWARTYRAEAAALTGGGERPGPDVTGGTEYVVLLARARMVESALNRQALAEAEALVIKATPDLDLHAHLRQEPATSRRRIIELYGQIALTALAGARRLERESLYYGGRVRSLVPAAALMALHAELHVLSHMHESDG